MGGDGEVTQRDLFGKKIRPKEMEIFIFADEKKMLVNAGITLQF